ncbi:MAG: hypothetical protein A2087_06995 [Spirochaetes bacterium GWD1_61_31]|nr:MAG: hypothetical protein A2Y37_08475 [Spirochaetes bacterium GWB1_60_80]OHD28476.1 MAG: hypothetical protein A2004_14780 [Spirochaetes bacterium GWC1_61_12]OHD40092.1 MAG: hypothetical protein A2087_06995 [Spirochaetes bacterium GWD1_61_31]OHD45860.1 MAG: hypothetical protein A2Y35_04110 [Spirochaetes bacterium GWE1_60_18]OHD58403.1 MAG: hypothetical protein A2Y32_06500 [Spirochaetes bacterium GWF1_60_12]HAW85383.1 hypothetical protein [Spirochaetaceae bacterium]
MPAEPNSLANRRKSWQLTGLKRFLVYAAAQAAVLLAPVPVLAGVLALTVGLGWLEGLRWLGWLRRFWPALLIALAPAVVGLPSLGPAAGQLWLVAWWPALLRSGRYLLVFVTAAWLSHGMTPLDLRRVLEGLLWPLGRRVAGAVARAAGLVLAFLPWTAREIGQAAAAARLRGSDPRRRPVRHLAGLLVPVALRSLERARHSAEALLLRDAGLAGLAAGDKTAVGTAVTGQGK